MVSESRSCKIPHLKQKSFSFMRALEREASFFSNSYRNSAFKTGSLNNCAKNRMLLFKEIIIYLVTESQKS